MSRDREYFDFIADLGMTKHYGSMDATRALIDLCRIDGDATVLDVGCGVGATPCYLAKTVGCRVVGVDLIERMVVRSRRRAEGKGVRNRVALAVADARALPMAGGAFDAVIAESVNVFFDDKVEAVREYVRATRPGGYVGITEMTWLKPPSPEIEEAFEEMALAKALDADGWRAVMEAAGLVDVVGGARQIDLSAESRGRAERYGLWGLTKIIVRMLAMVVGDRRARRLIGSGLGAVSKDLLDVVGYCVFAGRKP